MYLCNWGALTLPDGTRFTAGGAQIPLPKEIADELMAGKELGPVVDTYFKSSGIRNERRGYRYADCERGKNVMSYSYIFYSS